MSQRLTTSWISTVTPGSYITTKVISSPSGAGSSGILIIMGEADQGPDFRSVALKTQYFDPSQASDVAATYGAGPIVDAFNALVSPSNDQNISGAPSRIYVIKTNAGAKASASLSGYATLSAKSEGAQGNQIKVQPVALQAEVAPEAPGVTIAAFGNALNAASFSVRLNGSAVSVITLSSLGANHSSIVNLISEIDALLPAGVSAVAGPVTNSLKLIVDADSAAWAKGWGKSLELIDSTPGDLALLGLSSGLSVSAAEPSIEMQDIRSDISSSEAIEIDGDIALQIGYQGTSGTISITDTSLTTTVVGGAGGSLSVNLASFATMSNLVDYINSQTGYSASVPAAQSQQRPAELDDVTAIGIAASGASVKPGRIRRGAYNFIQGMATSTLVDATPVAYAGIPTPLAQPLFLSGGSKGATLASDIVDAVAQAEGVQANMMVPLFSRDASADIADGMTDSGSTYTIDAINALVKSHCLKMSTPKMKRNRIAFLSKWSDFNSDVAAAQTLATYRVSMSIQKASQINSKGVVTSFLPWMTACVAAGMQAAGLYKSLVNKYANVISFADPSGYDAGNPGSVEAALEGGLLILSQDNAGIKFISDQTTYGYDTNFVYNSIQAVYLSDILALDLADKLGKAFVGQSLADVTAQVAASFIASLMGVYKGQKIIAESSDAPLGYKNLKVKIAGPVMSVSLEVKLSTSLYFIPIELSISQIESSVS